MTENQKSPTVESDGALPNDALADQIVIQMDRASYEKFVALLDRPAQPNDLLRKTLRTLAPWDRESPLL